MLTKEFKEALLMKETNLDEALDRFSYDEDLYANILFTFPADTTIFDLKSAVANKQWDEAFTASHALKGLAGNLGLTPLFHSAGELVIAIRAGRIKDIGPAYASLQMDYDDIVEVIKKFSKGGLE